MSNYEAKFIGIDEFQKALERNPKLVIEEIKKFIQRGIAKYKSGIVNNPWRIGMSGGGSPVATGHMRDTHLTSFSQLTGKIEPTTNYAEAVHKGRPWLDYVYKTKMPELEKLEQKLLETIVKDLAK